MKLSCSAIAWGQVNDSRHFEHILESIKEAGYTGVGIEYNLLPKEMAMDPGIVKDLANDADLVVPSMAINENTAYQAEAASRMGAESGWLCLFENDARGAASIAKMHLTEFGRRGMEVGIHPHVKSNIETEPQLDQLLRDCAPLPARICFDSAHQAALRMDLPGFIHRYKDKINLVHLKDLRAMVLPKDIDYDHDFVDLGEGVVDFQSVLRALKEVKYEGWLMLEVDFAHKITVEQSILKNFEYLEPLV